VNARVKFNRFEKAREDRSAMKERKKKKELSILRVLRNSAHHDSAMITQELVASGQEISERTVRLYLQEMANDGLTTNIGKKGHQISEKGLGEFDSANIIDKVGFLSAKIDTMTYQMDFDLNTTSGSVVINVTLVEPGIFAKSIPLVSRVYKEGYAMGHLLTFLGPVRPWAYLSS
jgi:repressor of nif and glnA expression